VKAIVLCGGLGTRLGELTRALPKPLVEVAGRPFLAWVLDQLRDGGIDEFVLAVSFHWEKIRDAIGTEWRGAPVSYSVEPEPLGTGGAIRRALRQSGADEAIATNGDTLLKFDALQLMQFAREKGADIGLALKQVPDAGRFGKVVADASGRIASFEEKGAQGAGLINAGLYYVKASALDAVEAERFSFEQDVLKPGCERYALYGLPTDAYFIDMGVPEDLMRAREDLELLSAAR
jgi:D-glycero-alpha-D-manno-heptose 1-phosphate guanylyltransferase